MLGSYLKALRDAKGYTLRDVEKEIGISNAFLSQLESGKVKQPSPVMLYKLSTLYGVSYETLMERAGYPAPKPAQQDNQCRDDAMVASRLGRITPDEEQALLEYLGFLRSRGRREAKKK